MPLPFAHCSSGRLHRVGGPASVPQVAPAYVGRNAPLRTVAVSTEDRTLAVAGSRGKPSPLSRRKGRSRCRLWAG